MRAILFPLGCEKGGAVCRRLFSIYLVSTVLAVLVAARYLPTEATLEDESKRYRLEETKQDKKPPSMWTTVNLLRERRMFLLAPIYAGNGLIGAFLSANVSTVSSRQRHKPRACVLSHLRTVARVSSTVYEERDRAEHGGVQRRLRDGGELHGIRRREHLDRPGLGPRRPAGCDGLCLHLPGGNHA